MKIENLISEFASYAKLNSDDDKKRKAALATISFFVNYCKWDIDVLDFIEETENWISYQVSKDLCMILSPGEHDRITEHFKENYISARKMYINASYYRLIGMEYKS